MVKAGGLLQLQPLMERNSAASDVTSYNPSLLLLSPQR